MLFYVALFFVADDDGTKRAALTYELIRVAQEAVLASALKLHGMVNEKWRNTSDRVLLESVTSQIYKNKNIGSSCEAISDCHILADRRERAT